MSSINWLKVLYSVIQNEEALSGDVSISKQASIKDADKYCKVILRKSASRSCFTKFGVVLMLMIAICFSLFPNMKLLAWKKLNSVFQFQWHPKQISSLTFINWKEQSRSFRKMLFSLSGSRMPFIFLKMMLLKNIVEIRSVSWIILECFRSTEMVEAWLCGVIYWPC